MITCVFLLGKKELWQGELFTSYTFKSWCLYSCYLQTAVFTTTLNISVTNVHIFLLLKQSLCKEYNTNIEVSITSLFVTFQSRDLGSSMNFLKFYSKAKSCEGWLSSFNLLFPDRKKLPTFHAHVEQRTSWYLELENFWLWILRKPKAPLGIAINVSVKRHS